MKFVEKHWLMMSLAFLIAIGFLFRIKGLSANYSFWTDEDHVAIFARAILARGEPVLANGYSTGSYQWLWYWLTAASMKIFGADEFGARFPSVIFGILTIPAVYLVAKELFGRKVGLVSAIFTTFLVIEILWSRQARPYQAIQFFYLLEIIFFLKLLDALENKRNPWWWFAGLAFSIIVSSLMHWFGLLPIVFFIIYFLCLRFDLVKYLVKSIVIPVKRRPFLGSLLATFGLFAIVYLLYRLNFFFALERFIAPAFGKIGFYNHFGYYHSFLWRQYGLLTFLAIFGLVAALSKNWRRNSLILVIFVTLFVFINFRLRVPFTRYVYPVFPFLIILFSLGLAIVAESLVKLLRGKISLGIVLLVLAIFIVANGYKFSQRPKPVYSLNVDMQEIPEVDFKGIYQKIESLGGESEDWVLVTTWPDHATWYLGEEKPDYWLREREVVYGETKDPVSEALILGSSRGLEETIKKHPRGFVLLESWEPFVPEDAVEFVKKNFKKEFEIDRIYPVQPRYWPVEVFSWGFP